MGQNLQLGKSIKYLILCNEIIIIFDLIITIPSLCLSLTPLFTLSESSSQGLYCHLKFSFSHSHSLADRMSRNAVFTQGLMNLLCSLRTSCPHPSPCTWVLTLTLLLFEIMTPQVCDGSIGPLPEDMPIIMCVYTQAHRFTDSLDKNLAGVVFHL